jgi:hypothetical protein
MCGLEGGEFVVVDHVVGWGDEVAELRIRGSAVVTSALERTKCGQRNSGFGNAVRLYHSDRPALGPATGRPAPRRGR